MSFCDKATLSKNYSVTAPSRLEALATVGEGTLYGVVVGVVVEPRDGAKYSMFQITIRH